MTVDRLRIAATLLILLALALLVIGLAREQPLMWGAGLAAAAIALLMALVTQWLEP